MEPPNIRKILYPPLMYLPASPIYLWLTPFQNIAYFVVKVLSVLFCCSIMPGSATPWTTACQAFLSITNSQSLLKLMSTELVML